MPRTSTSLLTIAAFLAAGCSSFSPVLHSPAFCSRVPLDPAPPWTAAAAWNRTEDEMLLVDPGSRGLAVYGRDGRRLREVGLDALAELDYSVPMRLERRDDGFVLIDQTQILELDADLALRRRREPFAELAPKGFTDGSLNDVVEAGGALYGYADFVDRNRIPADDPGATGTWRRGFVRLDPRRGKVAFLLEMPLDDPEFSAYYLYDRRPYVAVDGRDVYVLRYTEPWTVHRATRHGFETVAAAEAGDDPAIAIHVWNGRLWVLTRGVEATEDEGETAMPVPENVDEDLRVQLLQARPASPDERSRWTLLAIDPRRGRRIVRVILPTEAQRLRLVPGRGFWTAIEETSAPNLGHAGDRTSFLFLPGDEILSGELDCLR